MSLTVCLGTSNTLNYPQGGHLWVFLNWALGFQAVGCRIIWLDVADTNDTPASLTRALGLLRQRVAPYELADAIALTTPDGNAVPKEFGLDCLSPDDAASADLLFDLRYDFPTSLVSRFRRSAMLDIDPGILQIAMQGKHMNPAPHDVYFTIGETVGRSGVRSPSLGLEWVHTPPCVSLARWPALRPPPDGAFTTVSHWCMPDSMIDEDGRVYRNDKREGFLPYIELPRRVSTPLELAIHLAGDRLEREMLEGHGWRVKEAHEVAATPVDFQTYVQSSRGEFGCAKPAFVKMQTSWISDRTLCYLASGRPAIIQDTGPSRYFSGREGVLRFTTFDEAIECFRALESEYARHSTAARALAEEHFAASKVVPRVLERCVA